MRCRLLLPMISVSVCLSVTQLNSASLCKNGWTNQNHVCGDHSWGPWNVVLYGSPDPPTVRGGELRTIFAHFDPLHISSMAEARDLKFYVLIEGCGPNHNYPKVWVTWPTLNFCDPLHISGSAETRDSNACSVCIAFDSAFAKLLWPLVRCLMTQPAVSKHWRRPVECWDQVQAYRDHCTMLQWIIIITIIIIIMFMYAKIEHISIHTCVLQKTDYALTMLAYT